jgi:predicted Zn-dependent protease
MLTTHTLNGQRFTVTEKRTDQSQQHNTRDNPHQYRRFVETARELGADESPDALDRAFERVVGKLKPKAEPKPTPRPKRR